MLCVAVQWTLDQLFLVSVTSLIRRWPPRAKHHPVRIPNNWNELGLCGRLVLRQCGPCPHVNPVSVAGFVSLYVWAHLCVLPVSRHLCSGFGVDQLRDDNLETYWQSDGSQPHLVNIQFRQVIRPGGEIITCFGLEFKINVFLFGCRRRTTVKMLCIYADYKSDESYTPSKISVRVGNNFHNLQEVRVTTT